VLLGVFGGLVSVYHSRVFIKIEHFFSHSKLSQYQKILLGGLILGSLIAFFPSLFGEGYESIKVLSLQQPHHLLDESLLSDYKKNKWLVLFFVGILVFIKPIATAVTMGSGGNGGNFAPSLFVGAYSGFFFSRFVNLLGFVKLPETNFTIVGMAGVLSGIYHAPLTAIFLIAEITGGYTLMIPLMIVSSISFAISKYFEPYSMDTKRLALKGDVFTGNKDKNILTTIRTSELLETNFYTVKTTYSLGDLVEVLSKSNRNIFPVINEKKELVGIILLDNIREIIFKHELYTTIFVADIMVQPPMIIDLNDSMEIVMKKFDETGAWNLPVIDNGKYMGFISKSSVFSSYRSKLKTMTVE
jgi:CIC family chloride channel protein